MQLAFLLVSTLVAVAACPPAPVPLVEFHFSRDYKNAGSLGGVGVPVTYAPGQGPTFGPGIRGTGLSLITSARGGGTDSIKTGGGVRVDVPKLGRAERATLALWFRAEGPNAPARLLYLAPSWDLNVSGQQVGFKIRSGKEDHRYAIPSRQLALDEGGWNFLAVTIDRSARAIGFFHAPAGGKPRAVAVWDRLPEIDGGEAPLEIGNLDGIRPFRGAIDSVRVYDSILTLEQIARVAGSDVGRGAVAPVESLGMAPRLAPLFSRSDVCLSSRWKRAESIGILRAFRANRLLWTYAVDAGFARECREAGVMAYQGSINSLPGTGETAAHALDFDGRPMVAPWMLAFSKTHPAYWACASRPRFLEISVARALEAVRAGADWLQFDDWALTASAGGWGGGCFCPDCIAGFREDLRRRVSPAELAALGIADLGGFDIREHLRGRHGIADAAAYRARKGSLAITPLFEAFQRRTTRAFFVELRAAIDRAAGRRVPLSINTTLIDPRQQRNFLTDLVDFVQGETLRFRLGQLALAARVSDGLGKWHVFVPESLETAEVRAGIASAYALGQLPLVPWDMYMGSDEKGIAPRGFGTPAEYADLFHFARGHGALLDEREAVATVAVVLDLDESAHTAATALCERLLDAHVPFVILPVGGSYFRVGLDRARLARFDAVLLASPAEGLRVEDRAALGAAARDVAIVDPPSITDGFLARHAGFEVWAPRDIHVLPRMTRAPGDRTLICHVLNRAGGGASLRWVSFVVRDRLALGPRVAEALWHTPARAEPRRIECETLPGGTRVILPEAPLWGIAELRFAASGGGSKGEGAK